MGWNYLSIPNHKLQRLHRWSLGMDKEFRLTLHDICNYLSMLGLKLIHFSKSGPKRSPTRRFLCCWWVQDTHRHNDTKWSSNHYSNVIMSTMASQITDVWIVYSNVCADQRKHQSSVSLAFVREIHRLQRDSNTENASIWWRHHDG